jgi:hypothetical protein
MATAVLSVSDDKRLEASSQTAPGLVGERRELERAIAHWEQQVVRSRRRPALMKLDRAEMSTDEWAYRFIIAVDSIVDNYALLYYGRKFAALLDLPAKPDHYVPMVQQLPARYVPVFTKGSCDATSLGIPARVEGAVVREDGRRELYRAVFIGLGVKPNSLTQLVFGAFNCRVTDRQK